MAVRERTVFTVATVCYVGKLRYGNGVPALASFARASIYMYNLRADVVRRVNAWLAKPAPLTVESTSPVLAV